MLTNPDTAILLHNMYPCISEHTIGYTCTMDNGKSTSPDTYMHHLHIPEVLTREAHTDNSTNDRTLRATFALTDFAY